MIDTSKITREECYQASETLVNIWDNCSYLDFADLCDILTAECILILKYPSSDDELTTKEVENIKSAAQLLQCASFCFAQAEKDVSGIVAPIKYAK